MLRAMTETRTRQAPFAHQPALDGLRAVAVSMVLLFHQGWLDGGYVGVSVFFTLSGYLITSLALDEHERTGRLDVGRFYARRLRRLLPASLACLVAIVALAALGLFDSVEHLRRDLYGALAQVYNWVALSSDQTYAELVGGGEQQLSPVAHYWSLAIEEQFYWVWPLVLVVVLRRGRRHRVRVIATMTALAAVAAPLIAGAWGPDAAYWATPARLAEILVGALVATVLHARRRDLRLPPATAWAGVAGAAVVVWAAITWPSASGPAYEGWLPVFAVASAAVVVGVQVASPMRRALSIRPLVALGAISYGVYLVHWPVYVVLSEDRTGLASVPLFVLRMAVTMPIAVLSYRRLEQPIRTGQLRHRPGLPAAAGACAAIALLVALVPVDTTPYWMRTDAQASSGTLAPVDSVSALVIAEPATSAPRAAPSTATTPATTATTVPPTTVAVPTTLAVPTTVATVAAPVAPAVPVVPALASGLSRPVRILVAGDSTAWATGDGMVAWAADHADVARASVVAAPGCGFIRDGIVPTDEGDGFRTAGRVMRDEKIPAALASLRPDVVVGMVSLRDIEDREWDPSEGPIGPEDDRFLARLVADYDAATQQFLAAGATDVLWVLAPVPDVPYQGDAARVLDPARSARYAAALAEVVARHPGQAAIVDMATWVAAQPVPPDRPDGLHWSAAAGKALAADFLGPIVVNAVVT